METTKKFPFFHLYMDCKVQSLLSTHHKTLKQNYNKKKLMHSNKKDTVNIVCNVLF